MRFLPQNKCLKKKKTKELNTTVPTPHALHPALCQQVQHRLCSAPSPLCPAPDSLPPASKPTPYTLDPVPCALFFEPNSSNPAIALCTHRPSPAQSALSTAARATRPTSASSAQHFYSAKYQSRKPARAQLRPRPPASPLPLPYWLCLSLFWESLIPPKSHVWILPCPVPPTDSTHS